MITTAVKEICDAIDELFGDMSVSKRTALERMKEIQDCVASKVDALKDDLRNEEEGT